MYTRQPRHERCILFPLAAILVVSALGSGRAAAQNITEIIDATGDGAGDCITHGVGNSLVEPAVITVDSGGNAYVAGALSDNAFKITPAGVITEIIDRLGDGAGNGLDGARGVAVDAAGNAYVTGVNSDNAFKITLDEDDDGVANEIDVCPNTPAGVPVDCEGRPRGDMDEDCDIDLADYALFAQYFTGP